MIYIVQTQSPHGTIGAYTPSYSEAREHMADLISTDPGKYTCIIGVDTHNILIPGPVKLIAEHHPE